ncbi:MAG: protein kinase [Hamadaea sp.]|nr:protein kinase [Hamadaea sp.]
MVLAGRYQLEQRVGSGGMGEVWKSFDFVLARTVAVKCLLDAPPNEPSFVDEFRAEARVMATISHPGVVEVYDFGDDPAAGVYLVMKYIDGESLAETLARVERLSAKATMRLVADAAEALHAAHEKGVTHRDVKPGNLLVRPDGGVLVGDFGIARSSGAAGHTAPGSLIGTASYIAPERALGRPATPASDIYSLGIVAYRCLAGRLPFAGDNLVEVALRHVHDEAPPLPPDVPIGVRAIVERAMEKDPANRWPSGAVLAQEARRALAESDVPSPRPQAMVTIPTPSQPTSGRRSTRRTLVIVAAGLVVSVLVAAGVLLSRGDDPQAESLGDGLSVNTASPLANSPATSTPPSPTATGSPSSTGGTSPAPRPSVASPVSGGGATPLGAPTNLTATPISASTIRLRWADKSTAEGGFTVINGNTSKNVAANTTTYDWTGLTPDTRTCFKVRAYNASGVSAYFPAAQNDWICATTLSGSGPAAPTSLAATPISASTIRLQWTDNSSDENGFTVINGNTSRSVSANTTTYDWTGLAPGTYMCFKVRAYTAAGVSAYNPPAQNDWVCVTTPTA